MPVTQRWRLAVLVASALWGACGPAPPQALGYYAACTADAECGAAGVCSFALGDVCTRTCGLDADCDALPESHCVLAGVCVRDCVEDADCPAPATLCDLEACVR